MPLTVGIPKEIKPREKRVGLTPEAAGELTRLGIPVLLEKGAGEGSGYSDPEYTLKGASRVSSAKELYAHAELIQKVKEPLPAEYPYLRKGLFLFGFLHLASPENCELLRALEKAEVTAVGFETLVEAGAGVSPLLPILAPMSEIAGGLGAVYGAFFQSLNLVQGNRVVYPPDFQSRLEQMASCYPTIPPHLSAKQRWTLASAKPRLRYGAAGDPSFGGIPLPQGGRGKGEGGIEKSLAVIFGGGSAGQSARRAFQELGREVVIVEKNAEKRKQLESEVGAIPSTLHGGSPTNQWRHESPLRFFSPEALPETILKQAGILIGCAHRVGERAAHVFDLQTLERISRGVLFAKQRWTNPSSGGQYAPTSTSQRKIIIDISIDQGGNFPGSHSTSYDDPLYWDSFGNLRFAVANIPSLAGRAASEALSKAALKYTQLLALNGKKAFEKSEALKGAVNLLDGKIVLETLRKPHKK